MKLLALISICIICCSNVVLSQPQQSEIKIVPGYNSISTMNDLLANFQGKPIFLDLWAPWCEPCKEEFSYSETLYKDLKKRGIQMLYVSLYKDVVDSAWRSDIYKYQLRGNHIKANQVLQDALTTMIWGAPGGFSIPRYLLFDKQGKVLLLDALPPSNGVKLLSQVDTALNSSKD